MSGVIRTIGGVPFGPTGLIAAIDWTRERLSAFGIPFPAGNRLQKARSLLTDVQDRRVILTSDADDALDRVTEAQWTILEQYIITRALGRATYQLGSLKRRKLEEMLSGATLPEDDRNHLARNTQFELYVAGLFTMGDVRATLAEPDLLIDYGGVQRGVAAKRVRSLRQAVRRADDAAEQLEANHVRGFVAVNVDVLLKTTAGGPGPAATLSERLDLIETIERRMAERDHVIGTLILGRDCVWSFADERPRADVSHSYRFTVHPRSDNDEAEGREFFDRMMTRIDARMNTL
jgi:hypothetical protein